MTVDAETGEVTAVGLGETTVRATGVDTGAEGRHALVVLPAPDAPGPVIPYYDVWAASAHADRTAAAFNNWNTNDPPVVPTGCARCHSHDGFLDYIGEDGSEFGVVDEPAPIGTTLMCSTCHNATAATLDTVTFPSVRNDSGHFNGASGAVRRWDNNEAVNASCSQCHGGKEGLHFYLEYGVPRRDIEQANGLECETCHVDIGGSYDLIDVPSVRFPSGVTLASDDSSSNLCASCHMGRESKATIDAAIANGKLSFRNVHYLPAAAVKAGSAARVGYEYGGKTYAGQWVGHPGGDSCNSCHSAQNTDHSFRAEDNLATCVLCHQDATTLGDIRTQAQRNVDYDGDGVIDEPLADEISGLAAALIERMHTLALATSGTGICYDSHVHPYFFLDTNGNGQCDGAAEAFSANGFKPWTPALMKAAHNYQISQKDPGAWSHNFDYMVQLLIDSIEDLGGDVSGYVRP